MIKRARTRGLLILIIVSTILLDVSLVHAEILIGNTPVIRFRLGSSSNTQADTVIYLPGIPSDMGGLPGVTAEPENISTTAIQGGSGVFRVRILTDVNSRGNAPFPLTGTFSFDSSNSMTCTTAATCGGETIEFTKIRWEARDGDTLNTVANYDGSANQVFQVQTDSVPGGVGARHRNFYQYIYINDILRPAGTYEGAITVNGTAQ